MTMPVSAEQEAPFTLSPPTTTIIDNGVTGVINRSCLNFMNKNPLQLQTLENLYSEEISPTQRRLKDYASALGFTFNQVSRWFIERRRQETTDKSRNRNKSGMKKGKRNQQSAGLERAEDKNDSRPGLLQDMLYSPDYVLKKVFRKDGPPLGVGFDSLPSTAFFSGRSSNGNLQQGTADLCPSSSTSDDERPVKRRKVPRSSNVDCSQRSKRCAPVKKHGMGKGLMAAWCLSNANTCCPDGNRSSKRQKVLPCKTAAPAKRHGMGKGLMTAWRVMNPGGGDYPPDVCVSGKVASRSGKPLNRGKTPQRAKTVPLQERLRKRGQNKKVAPVQRRKVGANTNVNQRGPWREKCGLALMEVDSEGSCSTYCPLIDDEELELMELQAGPNPLTCTDHFAASGGLGCPLCKGLLPKFPPKSVRMKPLLSMQPWVSSLELVKKLMKVSHFLYMYAQTLNLCPFTLDEFVHGFHDKESLLLGQIHVCLLELLLSDAKKELGVEFTQHRSKSFIFHNLLHSVEELDLIIWKKYLNPLTWTEILHQVLVAAGFGSKDSVIRKGVLNKEMNPVIKYGLRPGTLKGELFKILFEQGNKGAKVSHLASCPQIVGLDLEKGKDGMEGLICSTLSSDITFFEKISTSTFRLRFNTLATVDEETESDSEDSGSIEDSPEDRNIVSSCSSEINSGNSHSKENNMSNPGIEIDESHPGEAWVLGLVESEYSDLSVEEKLNAMVSLVDLLSAALRLRTEDPSLAPAESAPKIYQHGSGAKIKRSSYKQCLPQPSTCQVGVIYSGEEVPPSSEILAIDSSILGRKEKSLGDGLHTMQSLFLGSDRRYNKYWFFLGPCYATDPGHRRVYFESSEDGHWEVIDTEEALISLLAALDNRGRREAGLLASLEPRSAFLYQEMFSSMAIDATSVQPTRSDQSELDRINDDGSSPVSGTDGNSHLAEVSTDVMASSGAIVFDIGKGQNWSLLQAYDLWIWNSFYSNLHVVKHRRSSYFDSLTRCDSCHDLYWRDEKHCRTCHMTFELDFDLEEKYAIHAATCRHKEDMNMHPKHKVWPSQLQALKAAVHAIQLAMPEGAMIGAWSKSAHKLWAKRLRRTSNLHELGKVLADFVGAINLGWLSHCNFSRESDSALKVIVKCYSSVPQTSSAIALWLVKLDGFIASQDEGQIVNVPEG